MSIKINNEMETHKQKMLRWGFKTPLVSCLWVPNPQGHKVMWIDLGMISIDVPGISIINYDSRIYKIMPSLIVLILMMMCNVCLFTNNII